MQDQPVTLDFVSLERHFLVILQSALAARIGPNLEQFGTRLAPTLVDLVEKGRQHTAVATGKFRRDMPDPIPVVVLGRLTVQALSDDARMMRDSSTRSLFRAIAANFWRAAAYCAKLRVCEICVRHRPCLHCRETCWAIDL